MIADGRDGKALTHRARMVIAADGRRSAIAIGRGLSRQPQRPRRWAIGAYFSDVSGMTIARRDARAARALHRRRAGARRPDECVPVSCSAAMRRRDSVPPLAQPAEALNRMLQADPELAPRFADARAVAPPVMLGPMAVDTTAAGEPGLLLAGDAAGFIDPMTGDGLRFALLGAELAAAVVHGSVRRNAVDRSRASSSWRIAAGAPFRSKWRFNRALRSLVSSPASVTAAAATARVLPSMFCADDSVTPVTVVRQKLVTLRHGTRVRHAPAVAIAVVTVVAVAPDHGRARRSCRRSTSAATRARRGRAARRCDRR